jgi:PAS domain-containing protein
MLELRSLLLEVMILLGAWLCLAVLQKDPSTRGRKTFAFATGAWMIWCFGQLAAANEWFDDGTTTRLTLFGSLLIAPLWLGLASQTARLEIARRVPWFPAVLLLPAFGILALSFSQRWHGLFALPGTDGNLAPGPLWPAMLVYGFALSVAGCAILVATALRWNRPGEAARRIAICAAPLVTVIGSAAHFSGLWTLPFDPTPFLLGVTFVLLHGGIFEGGLLRPLGISQRALIEQLPVGIVLTDRAGVVIDVNPAAELRLGVAANRAIGRNFDAVIDAAGADVDFEITPVKSAGAETGQIVLLDPAGKNTSPSASATQRFIDESRGEDEIRDGGPLGGSQ